LTELGFVLKFVLKLILLKSAPGVDVMSTTIFCDFRQFSANFRQFSAIFANFLRKNLRFLKNQSYDQNFA
jgi:hypothetical protein